MDSAETLPPATQVDQLVPFRQGDMIAGKYRMDRILGVGGMGVVLSATHVSLGQRVAIKLMLPVAMKHEGLTARFEREARAAARLTSEHVARVFDVGEDRGMPLIVMELLEGQDLGDRLAELGPLPVATAVDYVLQACDAIVEAHAAGIVHRDLKPKNLFLTRRADGRSLVKVLDFGISKVDSPDAELSLTRTTEVMGSPNYMSPEQLRSARAVDERTDIWALGAILYELCTGRVPFEALTVTELCAKVLQDPTPSLVGVRPDAPVALDRIIARCLAKNREDRFAKVADLARALGTLRDGQSSAFEATVSASSIVTGPLPTPSQRSTRWVLGLLAVAALVGGVGAWLTFREGASAGAIPPPGSAVLVVTPPPAAEAPSPPSQPIPAPADIPSAAPSAPTVVPAPPSATTKKPTPAPRPPTTASDDLPASRH